MDTKSTLHGPGTYYFAFTGSKQQPIFHSVFEYHYAVQALANIANSRLIAYVLDQEMVQCVLKVEDDWTHAHADILTAFSHFHEHCWNKNKQTLAEQSTVLLIDDNAYLCDLVLQLHDWPRYQGKVVDASLWLWSSDRYYREPNPPAWLDVEPVLNRLAHSRRNRYQHYIAVMSNPIGNVLDLQQGNHEHYKALARAEFVEKQLNQQPQLHANVRPAPTSDAHFHQVCALVAEHLGLAVEELKNPQKRYCFLRYMPIVVWLLRQENTPYDDLAKHTDTDELTLELWMRSIETEHHPQLLNKLLQQWRTR